MQFERLGEHVPAAPTVDVASAAIDSLLLEIVPGPAAIAERSLTELTNMLRYYVSAFFIVIALLSFCCGVFTIRKRLRQQPYAEKPSVSLNARVLRKQGGRANGDGKDD